MAARWKNVSLDNITLVVTVLFKFSFAFERENFVFWPNGTVPFYVNPTHFDKEQSLAILSSLSLFTHKTCLEFRPVMDQPSSTQHVMLFENPRGVRKCVIDMEGHAKEEPHRITLGYECLRSPDIELVIMKALGFPFEHNRAIRDLYIDVQFENIEPGYIPFFTKEKILPPELRVLPYDVNSVMHFGEREYSKNGHRSFILKNPKTKQARVGLSKTDYRKIEIIYGPECQMRDRQAKIDVCKKYPSVRRKRDIAPDLEIVQNLRINRDITPPPVKYPTDEITSDIKLLNINREIQDLVELVHKISAAALENDRVKICNTTNTNTRTSDSNLTLAQNVSTGKKLRSNFIRKIIEEVINHVKYVIVSAKTNLTIYCDATNSIELFQRANCGWGTENRCTQRYKSTISGPIRYSTKHRRILKSFTTHNGRVEKNQYARFISGNDTQEAINTSKKEEDTEAMHITDLNNFNNKTKSTFITAANDSKESISRKKDTEIFNQSEVMTDDTELSIKTTYRRKRDIERPNITISYIKMDTNGTFIATSTKKENTNHKTATERDVLGKITKKSNESLLKKPGYIDKENIGIIGKGIENTSVNVSRDMLRLATKDNSDKKVAIASVNRRHRELFGHSDSFELNKEENGDDSSSSESDIRKTRTTKRAVDIRHKLERDRDRDEGRERKNRDREVNRPQNKRPKEKKRLVHRKKEKHISRLPETVPLTKANKEFYADRIWPDGVVRYVIAQDSTYNLQSMRARLEEVNEILKRKTCVRIEEISEREGQRYKDYLVIDTSADYVTGRVGGRQVFGAIELFEGGQHQQHAALMVMAMLGFYFELSRHDRDRYVRVHNRHIRPDKLHHFEKIRSDATLNLPYDYTSATHPAWQFWRRVGRIGISTVATYKDQDPDGSIMRSLGQNEQLLSNVDIVKINSIYGVQCFRKQRSFIQTR
ncbi:uncharacterized protein LOC120635561 [Pararge aegeria]|uniref:uncharacterized protein LOC120635561 n=1 Tax=Pararge aegeria TaxID=116150 RepID=UPI0019D0BF80|nr:uncharacterized protein LOC120635561 [Pararge aegeria]